MGIYKFKEEDAFAFASHIGIKAYRKSDDLIFKRCPYCGNQTDKENKFAINLKTGQFNCFRASCSAKGNMITLSRDFNFSLGRDADIYYQTTDYSSKQFRSFKDAHRKFESKSPAIEYLAKRGISESITQKYEITCKKDDDHTLIFPFKDEEGALQFIKYRRTNFEKGVTPGAKEWCEKDCKPILFGMNHCSPENGEPLIVTEGQIDSLSVAMAGFKNVVSVPTGAKGFTWVPYCWDFVKKFKAIIVMGDCENGKITLSEEIVNRWGKQVRVCRKEDYLDCKDANDILQKHGILQIRTCIENAEATYDSKIKPLSMVKSVDIMNTEKIQTRIKPLDDLLDEGLRMGQLVILTGKRGEGKSTIASQWAVEAIDQGKNVFMYSGELMNFMVKNWMDCQVTMKSKHENSDIDKLAKWYGDKAFIYDNTFLNEEDSEEDNIVETIKTAIEQRNCKVIIIDNLMTAITDDLSSDIYRMQSKFVGNLAAIAKKYGVLVILIAHPRKTQINQALSNDDVAGSSNITDKADLVITFGKLIDPTPEEALDENRRGIAVIKNRLTGKVNGKNNKQIKLVYDPTSRRLAEHTSDFRNVHYNWDSDPYGFDEVEDMEIPF